MCAGVRPILFINILFRVFCRNMHDARRELEENGVAVVSSVLTEDECDEYVAQIHEWLTKFGEDFPDNEDSIIHKYRIGHHEVPWNVRLKAKPLFSQLWETDKLLCSTDGMAIGTPPENGKENFFEGTRYNLHYDQSPERTGLHAYQGGVYLEQANEEDWCFAVIEKSHLHFEDFFKAHPPKKEFRELSKAEISWFEDRGCNVKRIPVPKGGIVLWDSRTVHTGARPKRHRKHPRWRYVVFVCMGPAVWASADDMETKKAGYQELRVSPHWPANGAALFPKCRFKADLSAVEDLPEIAKCEEARLLAGDLTYDFEDGRPNGRNKPQMQGRL